MHVQITTGKDSFRPYGSSLKRNVSVTSFVRVKDDGEGQQVVPIFVAYQKRLPNFKRTDTIQMIPATDRFGQNDAGQWFVNRHEVLPGTEILINYTHRTTQIGGFGQNEEYLLLLCDQSAPLYRIRLDLPPHELSSVPSVFFEGRFKLISNPEVELSPEANKVWTKYLKLDGSLQDVLDPFYLPEDQAFVYLQLEKANKEGGQVDVKVSVDGRKRVKINRTRKIRIK